MPRPSEDDREAVDRAFADLVAGYHLTADRPDPEAGLPMAEPAGAPDDARGPVPEPSAPDGARSGWADEHPLFRLADDEDEEPDDAPEREDVEERYVPPPPGPLPRPGWPVLLAWLGIGYAVLAVLAATLGIRLPRLAGWLAVAGFVGGFAILVTRLPRHRPPDAGDGAVL